MDSSEAGASGAGGAGDAGDAGHASDAQQMIGQVEFYFSDENLPQDGFLLGITMGGDARAWVPLRTLLSFKRLAATGATASSLAVALAGNAALELSDDGASVRRRHALPEAEPDAETLARSVKVTGLSALMAEDDVDEAALVAYFAKVLDRDDACVRAARVVRPERAAKPGERRVETYAAVELDDAATAHAAVEYHKSLGWRGNVQVSMLPMGKKKKKKKPAQQRPKHVSEDQEGAEAADVAERDGKASGDDSEEAALAAGDGEAGGVNLKPPPERRSGKVRTLDQDGMEGFIAQAADAASEAQAQAEVERGGNNSSRRKKTKKKQTRGKTVFFSLQGSPELFAKLKVGTVVSYRVDSKGEAQELEVQEKSQADTAAAADADDAADAEDAGRPRFNLGRKKAAAAGRADGGAGDAGTGSGAGGGAASSGAYARGPARNSDGFGEQEWRGIKRCSVAD